MFCALVLTDLVVYNTCVVSLNINATECAMLNTDAGSQGASDLETKVEPYASMILMSKSVLESILPAVLSLFLGPWSDRGGRRPLFLAGFSGFALMFISLSLLSDWTISPWYLLIASIPSIIVGGFCTVMLASTCHISDTTEEKYIMVELTLLEASLSSGELIGSLIGPIIYKTYGYSNIFRASAVCCTLAVVYVYIFIHETVKNASKESIRGLFKMSPMKELVSVIFGKRDGFNRPVVSLVFPIFTLNAMINGGYYTIGFLFTRAKLGWDVSKYSFSSAFELVMRIIGLCVTSILSPLLGIPDTILAGIGLVSALSGAIIRSLIWQSWHVYLSVCVEALCGMIGPVMLSILSKSVPAEDVGKVFSLTAFFDASSPLGGAPLFTLIYSYYLPPIYPSPVFLFSSTIYASLIFCLIYIHILLRKSNKSCSYITAPQEDNQ